MSSAAHTVTSSQNHREDRRRTHKPPLRRMRECHRRRNNCSPPHTLGGEQAHKPFHSFSKMAGGVSAIDSLATHSTQKIQHTFDYSVILCSGAGFEDRVHKGQENVTITAKWTANNINKRTPSPHSPSAMGVSLRSEREPLTSTHLH